MTSQRGSITVYAIMMVVLVMILIGLLVDGGIGIMARRQAIGIADEAARAGAGQIDQRAAYATGRYVVDAHRAAATARSYLARTGRNGSVQIVSSREIRVTVRVTRPTWLLSMLGIASMTGTGTSSAHLVPSVRGSR